MDQTLRIVATLPLNKLWNDSGFMTAKRRRGLTPDDVQNLLRAGRVEFVVADVGTLLRWIQPETCFTFWKTEARPHLAVSESGANLNDFPDGYCYFASEWRDDNEAAPIVVLEKHH